MQRRLLAERLGEQLSHQPQPAGTQRRAGPPGHGRYVIRTIWDISKVPVPFCVGARCKIGPDGQIVKGQTFMYKPGPKPVGSCETPYCAVIPGRDER